MHVRRARLSRNFPLFSGCLDCVVPELVGDLGSVGSKGSWSSIPNSLWAHLRQASTSRGVWTCKLFYREILPQQAIGLCGF